MGRPLATNPCKGTCDWRETEDLIDDRPVFACRGCESEWTTAERWTPQNADGTVADDVAAARAAHPVV